MSLVLLIVGLILFVGLVVVHEFGHFLAARRNGVEVEEFGIGFPPRAKVLAKKNGTTYTLNWLPLGGFVKLKGEHDSDTEKGSFGAATLLAKVKIMLAGVGMNLLTAFVVLLLSALVGIPKLIDNQFTVASDTKVVRQEIIVAYIEPGSPAEKAGFKVQDKIKSFELTECADTAMCSFEPVEVKDASRVSEITQAHGGEKLKITVLRDGKELLLTPELRKSSEVEASKNTDNPKGYLGVSPSEYVLQRSTWSAPIVAGGLVKQFTELTLKGLGSAIAGLVQGDTKKASSQVAGPVGIFVVFQQGSHLGYEFILFLIGLISLTLAIMNVLPIPALDGGRLFVTLLFRAFKRPLKENIEDLIHGGGFAVLMALFVLITIVDIRRFF